MEFMWMEKHRHWFQKIYSYLSTLETQELEEKQLVTKVDRYHWLLFLVLLLLIFDKIYPLMHERFFQKFTVFIF